MGFFQFKWFTSLFTSIGKKFKKLAPAGKKIIHTSVMFLEELKTGVINSPLADLLVKLWPGDKDDIILAKLREIIPKVIVNLKIVDLPAGASEDEIIKAASEFFSSVDADFEMQAMKEGWLHNLMILISRLAADGEFDQKDLILLGEWYFQHKIKKGEEIPLD